MVRRLCPSILVLVLGALGSSTAWAEPVLIRCARPCTTVVQTIERQGGTVVYQYKYVDAIAADVPSPALPAVRTLVKPGAITKDLVMPLPDAAPDWDGRPMLAETGAASAGVLDASAIADLAGVQPDVYLLSNALMNVNSLHADGVLGTNINVAVIDSGVVPVDGLRGPGKVVHGPDFTVEADFPELATLDTYGHGTHIAGIIAEARRVMVF